MKVKQIIFQAFTIFIVAFMLVGCGSSDENAAKEETTSTTSEEVETVEDTSGSTETRVFTHLKGETEIPVEPKRVVTTQYIGQMLALEVKPVGATGWTLNNPYFEGMIDGVENIGDEEISLEKILALEPDLIIGTDWDEEIYEELSKIAPTILIPWMEHDVNGHLNIVADALGKKDEAEKFIQDFEEVAAEKSELVRNYVGEDETVLIFRIYPDSFSVYGDRNLGHVFYNGLGLTPPPFIQAEMDKNPGSFNQQEISLEVLPDYSADHMIVLVNDLKEAETQLKQIQDTKLWQGLPAVQNNKVYYIERTQWLAYDSTSVLGQLKDAAQLFEKE
ncbi:ABC transporter substrate-binding protein [Sutcliffiella horikoshii]|uniref:ABC transporter substrate-binding protein n=1 Tax=Sutcliffiella horikoshii TaxID=79883 RepID=A0A5D4S772_9BACI|nr:ABC transporter substrate-binding protein [Sutcliffiella horikoshii]TYS59537.1 ABC transporter substrate-binding protein [Sutcliffiella horikoshii]